MLRTLPLRPVSSDENNRVRLVPRSEEAELDSRWSELSLSLKYASLYRRLPKTRATSTALFFDRRCRKFAKLGTRPDA